MIMPAQDSGCLPSLEIPLQVGIPPVPRRVRGIMEEDQFPRLSVRRICQPTLQPGGLRGRAYIPVRFVLVTIEGKEVYLSLGHMIVTLIPRTTCYDIR